MPVVKHDNKPVDNYNVCQKWGICYIWSTLADVPNKFNVMTLSIESPSNDKCRSNVSFQLGVRSKSKLCLVARDSDKCRMKTTTVLIPLLSRRHGNSPTSHERNENLARANRGGSSLAHWAAKAEWQCSRLLTR